MCVVAGPRADSSITSPCTSQRFRPSPPPSFHHFHFLPPPSFLPSLSLKPHPTCSFKLARCLVCIFKPNNCVAFNYSCPVKRADEPLHFEPKQRGLLVLLVAGARVWWGEGGQQEIPCEELMRSWRLNRHNRGEERGRRRWSDIWPPECDLVHCLTSWGVDAPERSLHWNMYWTLKYEEIINM